MDDRWRDGYDGTEPEEITKLRGGRTAYRMRAV